MAMGELNNNDSESAIERKVRFLRQPTSFAEQPLTVDAIETHMSWVFLTDDFAYKLKKPVIYDFLDFSTVDARFSDCQAELRLNRRLAPEIYLGLVPLTVDPHGSLALAGEGDVVDWLIKMRRLPQDCMLDWAIQHQTVREDDIRKVSRYLARFYQHLSPIDLTPSAYRLRLSGEVSATMMELLQPSFGLPEDRVRHIAASQQEFLDRHSQQLDNRVQADRIIEGHGDLRPEHICLKPEPAMIDCLEFKQDLRILDPVDEFAFLALECERLGAAWIGDLLLETYSNETGDRPPASLVAFYKSYRAYLRAKIAIWHTREPGKGTVETWRERAMCYLSLAERHLAQTKTSGRSN